MKGSLFRFNRTKERDGDYKNLFRAGGFTAQGMVEFALVLPLLLFLSFGIIELGRLFVIYSVPQRERTPVVHIITWTAMASGMR